MLFYLVVCVVYAYIFPSLSLNRNDVLFLVCDCGVKGTSCNFKDDGTKVCECAENYAQKDDTCIRK